MRRPATLRSLAPALIARLPSSTYAHISSSLDSVSTHFAGDLRCIPRCVVFHHDATPCGARRPCGPLRPRSLCVRHFQPRTRLLIAHQRANTPPPAISVDSCATSSSTHASRLGALTQLLTAPVDLAVPCARAHCASTRFNPHGNTSSPNSVPTHHRRRSLSPPALRHHRRLLGVSCLAARALCVARFHELTVIAPGWFTAPSGVPNATFTAATTAALSVSSPVNVATPLVATLTIAHDTQLGSLVAQSPRLQGRVVCDRIRLDRAADFFPAPRWRA